MSSFRSFPTAVKMIFTDPINLILAIIPTIIALFIYVLSIVTVYRNSDRIASYFRGYIYTADQADLLAKVLTAVLLIFIFLLMSWTFVIVVGIIAAPFNSMLSARIEKRLVERVVEENKARTFRQIAEGIGRTFKNEAKKLIFILILSALAFVFNMFPLLYPVGIFLVSLLLAIQFIDYSWSRHDMSFGTCLKDTTKNIFSYAFAGFCFLLLVTIPIINAFIPALATSYFTVLWLHRQKKIPQVSLPPQ